MVPAGWQLMITVVGSAIAVVGGMIVFNLRTIKSSLCEFGKRLNNQDEKIAEVFAAQTKCQRECTNRYVDKVDFIRNVNKQERSLDSLVKLVSEIKGSMRAFEQLPKMSGEIAREIVKELKK
ncbi:MAG: hypothetical protein DRP65_00485 [Planctomycetota bacterium]|nr:MAG: hypothetical protein DRP65_00485 [Planctomycetota bacterium]